MNIRGWLVRLYPPGWRERYGEEFEALLEQCLHGPMDVLDIVLGALDAHLGFTAAVNWRSMNMNNKLRTAILLVFAAYIAFIVAGMGLYGLADDSPMAALMKTGADLPLLLSWLTVQAGALIALLAVVIGGLPLAWIVIRRALTSSRQDLRLLLVPVLSFLALVLYAVFVASIGLGRFRIPGVAPTVTPDNFPLGNRLLIGGGMLVFVLGAIASTAAVWRIISQTDVAENTFNLLGRASSVRPYEYALVPAAITSAAMLLMLLATVAWGWFGYSAMPQVFSQNWGLLQSNTTVSLLVIIAIMAVATALAFVALARARAARTRPGRLARLASAPQNTNMPWARAQGMLFPNRCASAYCAGL